MERAVHHDAALPRHTHRAAQVGDAGFREPGAVLENFMEGIVGHKAGAQRQENADQKAQEELLPNSEVQPAAFLRLRPVRGSRRLRRECSTGVRGGMIVHHGTILDAGCTRPCSSMTVR